MRDGDWYWISRRVFEDYASKIGVVGLALYNAYASYARDKGIAFPSQRILREKLGVSLKTVRKYNRILLENGLIKLKRRKGKSNIVILLKVEDGNQLPNGWESDSRSDGKGVLTKDNNFKENINIVNSSSPCYSLFSYYLFKVKEVWGFKPAISWAKECRLLKQRLKEYSLEKLKDLIDWYLNSKHSERLGFSLSTCLSSYVINLWLKESIIPK